MFGRKINQAECQLAFIEFLRHIADGVIEPPEAVRAYHAVLEKLKIPPRRSLEEDLQLQTRRSSYAGTSRTFSFPKKTGFERSANGAPPVLSQMSSQERVRYLLDRIADRLGE